LNLQRKAAESQREEEKKMKEMEAEWLVCTYVFKFRCCCCCRCRWYNCSLWICSQVVENSTCRVTVRVPLTTLVKKGDLYYGIVERND